MPTIFSRIIAGEIPSYSIAENEHFFAFLDIHPIVKGHTLVIPKLETDQLFDLPATYLSGLLPFSQPIAAALKKAFGVKRVGLSVMGMEVPHAHLHLLPINSEQDMNFANPKLSFRPEEFLQIQQQVIAAL